MSRTFYRETWAEVHLDAIENNVQQLIQHLPSRTRIMAVVKADGYGHGAVATAKAALKAGTTWLGVAILEEAIELRKAGIHAPILVLGRVQPQYVRIAAEHNISLTAFQTEWLKEAAGVLGDNQPLFIHLKLDSGMGRLGITEIDELKRFVSLVQKDNRLILEGAFTHFATADENDLDYFEMQNERFEAMLQTIKDQGVNPNLIHAANSAAAMRFPNRMYDIVRFGISMYGLTPSYDMKPDLPFELQQAFSLRSRIINIKELAPGEGVSYGATYKTREREWIGTVPIGYADGWIRHLSVRNVLVENQLCPIVGRICMDQLMVRLNKKMPLGTLVTLLGYAPDGETHLSIDDVARTLGTISYEIPCMITERVPRIYYYKGQKVKEGNLDNLL